MLIRGGNLKVANFSSTFASILWGGNHKSSIGSVLAKPVLFCANQESTRIFAGCQIALKLLTQAAWQLINIGSVNKVKCFGSRAKAKMNLPKE